jgi:hypothetical protein
MTRPGKRGKMSGARCKYCGYQAQGVGMADVLRDLTDHAQSTGHSRKNTADATELQAMRQRTAEQQRTAKQHRTAEQRKRIMFPGLGVHVRDGMVYAGVLSEGHLLGELKGAHAEITDSTRARRAGVVAASTVLVSPVGVAAGLLLKKNKATVFVVFPDGGVRERMLDGNAAIRGAQRDVVKFNALAASAGRPGS